MRGGKQLGKGLLPVAIVTGAASGIGQATARMFAEHGARVIAVDVAAMEQEAVEGEGHIVPLQCDITAPDAPARIMDLAGPNIAILANVAGIMDGFLPAGEVDDGTWDKVIAVNVTAPMRLMRAVLPGMVAQGGGAIVNVASEAGLKGGCAGAAYTASKHALIGLSKNSAFLYAPKGVRINVVAPGPVETGLRPEFRSALAAERLPALIKASISGMATPRHIANAIVWLAGEQSAMINGAVLAVDDGWSAA